MTRLTILHETRYAYDRPVGFGAHRLLVRPRDSHALRVVEAGLTLSPAGDTRWVYDALGNCVCWWRPQGQAQELSVISRLLIERFPAPLAPIHPQDPHSAWPIVYEREDRTVLAPFVEPACDDPDQALLGWIRGQMAGPGEPALDFLLRVNRAIHDTFDYRERYEPGVQSPDQTVRLRAGSCRDLAWLMVEAMRRLGFAARFVTGYLNSPTGAWRGAGATHAWCEVFLPGLGWTEFDPTNGLAESADLIPVAATRTPAQAAPVSGLVIGDPGASQLWVKVEVGPEPFQAAA